MRRVQLSTFLLPAVVAVFVVAGLSLGYAILYLPALGIGLALLFVIAYKDIRKGSWSLDYIAFLAMTLALVTNEWLAGAVIALMYTSGSALEEYASRRASASLSALLARLPKAAVVKDANGDLREVPLAHVTEGTIIVVRGGELVPLDGFLYSQTATLNLANLTGEPLPETVANGAFVKSGSVNAGGAFELRVAGSLATSTYAKIIDLVREGAADQAPFVRLADRANLPFTILTLLISGAAYLATGGDLARVLAVLVIATPCPLIIAAPVAFVGALSRAAGRNIIVKRPATLEALANVTTVFFDKTGTLTLGEPALTRISLLKQNVSEEEAHRIAAALELHSIHPLARTIVRDARARGFKPYTAEHESEVLGTGVAGVVNGVYSAIEVAPTHLRGNSGIALLLSQDGAPVATFHFDDVLKDNVTDLVESMKRRGLKVAVLTGDTRVHAETIFGDLLTIYADLEPADKFRLVEEARKRGERVAMVGDGLNDAPALAKADVGIVFSGTENSASIDAAGIAILGHDPLLIEEVFSLAERSVKIAGQSVYAGIALSVLGQFIAVFGYIPPVTGAIIQEGIDVTVILNALRTAFGGSHTR